MEKKITKVVTVGVYCQGGLDECESSLKELERLVLTAGGAVFATLTQLKNVPDASTYIGEGKLNTVQLKELLILLDDRVLGLGENLDQRIVVKLGKRNDDGETANKLGNETEFDDIVGGNVAEYAAAALRSIFACILA